jgi:hypothetical protein
VVVLSDGTVLTGELIIPSFEAILIKHVGIRSVFTAQDIRQVRYYDAASDINRVLFSFQDSENGSSLYERVVCGHIQVVRKPKQLLLKTYQSDCYDYDYYFIVENRLLPLMQFRREYDRLANMLEFNEARSLKKMCLNPNKPSDAIRIIQLLNKFESDGVLLTGS